MYARKRIAAATGCAAALIAGGVALGSGAASGSDPSGDATPAKLDITAFTATFAAPSTIDGTVTLVGAPEAKSDTTKVELDFGTGVGAACGQSITAYAYRDGGSVTVHYASGGTPKAAGGQSSFNADKTVMTMHVALPAPADVDPTCVSARTIDDNGGTADSTAPVALAGGSGPVPTATATGTPNPTPVPTPAGHHPKKKKCTKKQLKKHKKNCRRH